MSYREVTMLEIKEVLRLWLGGLGTKPIARQLGLDPKTVRRYLYWARYLHQRGRHQAAWAELQHMLRKRPADPEALALREQIRAALPEGVIPALPADTAEIGRAND